jgi:hypothetical protein
MVLCALFLAAGLMTAAAEGPVVPKERTPLWNGKDFTGWKLFLEEPDVDVKTVWSVKDEVIHCTGAPNGYMRTETDYANYRLHVEWRWPEEAGNSGVLLHMTGEDKVWPRSIECQLNSGDAGDFWLFDGFTVKEPPKWSNDSMAYVPKQKESSEKPPGDWNMPARYVSKARGNRSSSATYTSIRCRNRLFLRRRRRCGTARISPAGSLSSKTRRWM